MDSNARGEVVEVARLLIPAGADANAKNSQGRTAADIDAAMGKPEADYCGVGIGMRFRLRDFKVFRLPCEAGLGDCTAEARPSTGSGHGEPVEPRRTRRKSN